jgi:hypothetical protein
MSHGDSLDGFVFPPFIPPAAARPAEPPAPASPAPMAEEPRAEPQSGARRATMPWDVETPIVRESPLAAEPVEDEDLPWLERPEPREAAAEASAAPATDAAPARDEAFPDWLAWDDRDLDDARSEAADVAPVDGLEDFVPTDELGGFIATPPAVEWAEAAPEPAQADAADASSWSLDAPEAVEPPILAETSAELTFESPESAAELTFDSPASAAGTEPAFEVTLDDGAFTFAAAGPVDSAVDAEPVAAPPEPFVADTEAVIAAEPDPFTSSAVHEAETVAPVDAAPSAVSAAGGAFADVAARLEDIARTLRERPDDLLSGNASDPLALLVAGYVMGYSARR